MKLLALLLAVAWPVFAQAPPRGPAPRGGDARGEAGMPWRQHAPAPHDPAPPPPPGPDRVFLQAQILRAIEGKASLYMEQGKIEAALDELKKALTVDIPRDHPLYEAKVHLVGMLAITYTNVGKKKEGVETIQKLLQEAPPGSVAEASAYLDAGTVYRQAGMPDEALKAFDRAIELSQKLAARPPRGPAGHPMPPPPGPPQGPTPKQKGETP